MTSEPDLQIFETLDDTLNAAFERNDVGSLMSLLADEWTLLEPGFGIISKSRFLDSLTTGKLSHSSMKKSVVRVTRVQNIAIVISRGRNSGVFQGEPYDTVVWVSNTYACEDGRWLCVATQESPVPCP